jgi:alpha-galactosidase
MAISTSRRTTKRASKSGWSSIRRRVSPSQFLGTLYDIGFDLPEAHVIRKDKEMYYAFFARNWKAPWSCAARANRLRNRPRSVTHLSAEFTKHLLLEATPQQTY